MKTPCSKKISLFLIIFIVVSALGITQNSPKGVYIPPQFDERITTEYFSMNEMLRIYPRGELSFQSVNNLDVLVVDRNTRRMKGLSGTAQLPRDMGMYFVFPKEGNHAFWMKDMNYAIDMIWFNEDMEIVHLEEKVSPKTYPKSFGGDVKSRYVLEVNAGFIKRNNITLDIQPEEPAPADTEATEEETVE